MIRNIKLSSPHFRVFFTVLLLCLVIVIVLIVNLRMVNNEILSLDTKNGRQEHFDRILKDSLSRSLMGYADFSKKNLQYESRRRGETLYRPQFFTDDTSGVIIANRREEIIGSTNEEAGGLLWNTAFNEVKDNALRQPADEVFSLSYFNGKESDASRPKEETPRYGVGYYNSSRGYIMGLVVGEDYFAAEKTKLYERFIWRANVLSAFFFLTSVLTLGFFFAGFYRRDKRFHEYEQALNNTSEGVALMNADSTVTYVNKYLADNYERKYLGRRLTETSQYPYIREKFQECLDKGIAQYRNRARTNGQVTSSSVTLTRYYSGGQPKVMMMITDVTDVVNTFVTIAHDVKEALHPSKLTITGAINDLKDDDFSKKETTDMLREIHFHITAAESMALYLEAWGINVADDESQSIDHFSIETSLLGLKELYKSSFKVNDVVAKFDLQQGLLLNTEQRSFEVVIRNLLTNSIQAFKNISHPQILIRTRSEGNDIIVEVIDNASGMTPERRKMLFSEDVKNIKGGASIVSFFAKKLNGTLVVEEAPSGQGTMVTLRIPNQVM